MVLRKIVASMMSCLGISKQPKEASSSSTTSIDPLVAVVPLRIRLGDGRYLAYKESGVPKSKSIYRIIVVHGFGSSKDMNFMAPQVSVLLCLNLLICCLVGKIRSLTARYNPYMSSCVI